MLSKVLGPKYDKKVVRRRENKADLWDKAAEIEDKKTEEKQWKFKSDGTIVPKPDESSTGYLFYRKLWHKLTFQPRQRVEFAEFVDKGNGSGEWAELDQNTITGDGHSSAFQTHRNLQAKKYVELYSDDTNQAIYIIGALALIVVMDIISTYMIVNGLDKIAASSLKQAVESAQSGAGAATDGGVPGVSMLLLGLRSLNYKARRN